MRALQISYMYVWPNMLEAVSLPLLYVKTQMLFLCASTYCSWIGACKLPMVPDAFHAHALAPARGRQLCTWLEKFLATLCARCCIKHAATLINRLLYTAASWSTGQRLRIYMEQLYNHIGHQTWCYPIVIFLCSKDTRSGLLHFLVMWFCSIHRSFHLHVCLKSTWKVCNPCAILLVCTFKMWMDKPWAPNLALFVS